MADEPKEFSLDMEILALLPKFQCNLFCSIPASFVRLGISLLSFNFLPMSPSVGIGLSERQKVAMWTIYWLCARMINEHHLAEATFNGQQDRCHLCLICCSVSRLHLPDLVRIHGESEHSSPGATWERLPTSFDSHSGTVVAPRSLIEISRSCVRGRANKDASIR